jgi:cytochrome bd-type quinol oxidase subunit 2
LIGFDLTHILILITGIALIILVVLIYIRSRQGDQRVINTTNQMLLPILSAIVITLNIVLANHQAIPACTGTLNMVKYTALILALLLVIVGILRFFMSRNRDKRLITHPILFAIIVVTVLFLIESLNGCL